MATASEKTTEITLKTSKEAQELVAKSDWGFDRAVVAATWAQYPELTQPEVGRFLFEARRLGLDPATGRQVFPVIYNKDRPDRQLSIQVGIAGFRLIAARTELMNGSADVEDGPEVTTEYKADNGTVVVLKHPQFCRSRVWRRGSEHPFEARVRWEERVKLGYNKLPSRFWVEQPYGMLEKCAEAAALRKAFPLETRGVVLEGENPDPFPSAIETTATPAPTTGEAMAAVILGAHAAAAAPPSANPTPEDNVLESIRAEIRAIMDASADTSLGLRMKDLFNARLDAMGGPTFALGKAGPQHRAGLEALRDDLRQLQRQG